MGQREIDFLETFLLNPQRSCREERGPGAGVADPGGQAGYLGQQTLR